MEKKLSQQEKALIAIFIHFRTYRFFPKSSDIQASLNLPTVNSANRLKSELLKKDMICKEPSGSYSFTRAGFNKLRSLLPYIGTDENELAELENLDFEEITQNDRQATVILRTDIPIKGQVVAGTDKKPEDLVVDMGKELGTLSIPDAQLSDQVFALKVVGKSMIHENILPGDFLIMHRINADQIVEKDLIVVSYLSEEKSNDKNLENLNLAVEDPDNFMGPTVKFYDEIYKHENMGDRFSRVKYIRLSWKTQANESPYLILTRAIDPNQVYRVTGIYRSIGREKQRSR